MSENDQDLETKEVEATETEPEEKKELTPEQLQGIKKRQFTKLAKELGIELPKPKTAEITKESSEKSDQPDYAKLAYLESKGVSEADYDYIFNEAKQTGKEIKELLSFNYIKEELKRRKDERTTEDSLPTSKRGSGATRDTVGYWTARIAKGEATVLDIEDKELRKKVMGARLDAVKRKNKFTDHPFA